MAKAKFKVRYMVEMEVVIENEDTLEDCKDVILDSSLEALMKEREYYIDDCQLLETKLSEVLEASFIVSIKKLEYYNEEDTSHEYRIIKDFSKDPIIQVVNDVNVDLSEHHCYDEIESAIIETLEEENLCLKDIVSADYQVLKEY